MKKFMCWAICGVLIAPAIIACGCDRPATTVAPADTKAHMAAKDAKESGK